MATHGHGDDFQGVGRDGAWPARAPATWRFASAGSRCRFLEGLTRWRAPAKARLRPKQMVNGRAARRDADAPARLLAFGGSRPPPSWAEDPGGRQLRGAPIGPRSSEVTRSHLGSAGCPRASFLLFLSQGGALARGLAASRGAFLDTHRSLL